MFEFLEDFEIEWGRTLITGVFWVVIIAALWVIPKSFNAPLFPLGQRIFITLAALPLIYLILTKMADD